MKGRVGREGELASEKTEEKRKERERQSGGEKEMWGGGVRHPSSIQRVNYLPIWLPNESLVLSNTDL